LLWISGKAGSGKSVLAKSIHRRFEDSRLIDSRDFADPGGLQTSSFGVVCDWFYHAHVGKVGTSHEYMLRALVWQMFEQNQALYDICKKRYHQRLYRNDADSVPLWTIDALVALIKDLAADQRVPRILFIIDGLDEAEDGDSECIEIAETLACLSNLPHGRVRTVVFSRPDPQLGRDAFRGSPHIDLGAHNTEDVRRIVEAGLETLRTAWKTKLRCEAQEALPDDYEDELQQIQSHLIDNASGVVLWATLVPEDLRSYIKGREPFTLKSLRKRLVSLPTDVEALYSDALSKLGLAENAEKRALSKKILTWIIGCRKWTSLQQRQLRAAIAGLDESELIMVDKKWELFLEMLHHHCGYLVEARPVSKGDHPSVWVVDLVHETVQTFLENPKESHHLQVNPDEAAQVVTSVCYEYLGFTLPSSPASIAEPFRDRSIRPSNFRRDIIPSGSMLEPGTTVTGLQANGDKFSALRRLCDEKHLTSVALRIVDQTLVADDCELLKLMPWGCDPEVLGRPFIAYWFADAYHASVPTDTNPLISSFVNHCCQTGSINILDAALTAVERFRPKAERVEGSIILGPEENAAEHEVINGAVYAFLAVSHRRPLLPEETGSRLQNQLTRSSQLTQRIGKEHNGRPAYGRKNSAAKLPKNKSSIKGRRLSGSTLEGSLLMVEKESVEILVAFEERLEKLREAQNSGTRTELDITRLAEAHPLKGYESVPVERVHRSIRKVVDWLERGTMSKITLPTVQENSRPLERFTALKTPEGQLCGPRMRSVTFRTEEELERMREATGTNLG
jgi:hypothetical protein